IYNEQNVIALYEDSQQNLYRTLLQPNGFYPPTMTMNVYESQGGSAFEYIDDWGNVYTKAVREDTASSQLQNLPNASMHMGGGTHFHQPFAPMMHGQQIDPRYAPVHESQVDQLGGSLSHMNLGDASVHPQGRAPASHAQMRPTGSFRPPTQRMGESQPSRRIRQPLG
ncbi:hypothetical protein, partial [Escherichia coli]|uniref:hypothetical protein n=1 Tax=Escherichia coli TaxID=562 RepID=UPI00257798B5